MESDLSSKVLLSFPSTQLTICSVVRIHGMPATSHQQISGNFVVLILEYLAPLTSNKY